MDPFTRRHIALQSMKNRIFKGHPSGFDYRAVQDASEPLYWPVSNDIGWTYGTLQVALKSPYRSSYEA